MQDHVKHELFDRYLREELNENELDAFLERLEADPEFASEFELHRHIAEGIKEQRREELKAYLRENAQVRSLPNSWSKGMTWLVAAVILAFAISYFVFIPQIKEVELAQNEPSVGGSKKGKQEEKQESKQSRTEEISDKPGSGIQTGDPGMEEDAIEESKDLEYPDVVAESAAPEKSSMNEDYSPLPVRADVRLLDTLFTMDIAFHAGMEKIPAEKEKNIDTLAVARTRGAKKEASQSVKIVVQLWKSPINYKGYRFDGRKLELFGIDTVEQLSLKYLVVDAQLEVYRVFVKYGEVYYPVVDDNQYHAYRRETDKAIIEQLK